MKRKYAAIALSLAFMSVGLGGCTEIESFLEDWESRQGEEIQYQKLPCAVVFGEAGNILESAIEIAGPENLEEEPVIEYYPAAAEYAVDMETEGESYTSRGANENAVHVYGEAQVLLKNAQISRTARDSEEENLSAYGAGAAMLTTSGTSYLKNSTITTSADRSAGIFAYRDGAVYAAGTMINTRKNASEGVRSAGGGTVTAWNLKVETEGKASAALRSDRQGCTIVADGGTYTARGANSPAVHSGGTMAIRGGTLTAEQWEAVSMKGNQSLYLYDCDVSGNKGDDISNDCTWNILIYESQSGNHGKGHSTFEMNGGTLSAKNGGMLYTTNVESVITLSNVKIAYPMVNEFFLKCTGNNNQREWGERGVNGAVCRFTASEQDMEGDVIWDGISELDFYMSAGSTLKGAVRKDDSYAGSDGEGHCNLYVGEGCTWTVTGDSTLSRLSSRGTLLDDEGNAVTVEGKDGTLYMQGTGKYTVTVDTYEAMTNMSGASEPTTWMEHQVEIPQELQ